MIKIIHYGCGTAILFYAPDLKRFGAFVFYDIPYSVKGGVVNG